jgi:putative tricarboxylic transport membrane protein
LESLSQLLYGFSIGLQPHNLLFCFIGVVLGTLVGVLPGIGPTGTIAILLPVTYRMDPTSAIIMLAGVYYGVMYGGSTTSILVKIPGEVTSIVTVFDGYEMAKQGRAGPALGIAAFGSFIAGTLAVIGLMIFAPPISEFALRFGPPEYFSVMFFGIVLITYLSQSSVIKAIMMAAFGLILSCVGLDYLGGMARMTFDSIFLADGFNIIPMVMGLFGISEILINIEKTEEFRILETEIKSFLPTFVDWMQSKWAILRGTVIGFFFGLLPGGNPVVPTFLSYTLEKRISKEPQRFGKGAIEGVAGPESTNNAASCGCFIPLLTLGIPSTPSMALLFAAFVIHGINPGPFLLEEHPDLFWGLISSMYIANGLLLVLNLPLIPMWVKVLKIPYRILFPLIALFCIVGSFSINNNIFDVKVMMIFGLFGYLLQKFRYEIPPLILAFVLGPKLEVNLRQALIMSGGSFSIFFNRPLSAIFMITALILFFILISSYCFEAMKR